MVLLKQVIYPYGAFYDWSKFSFSELNSVSSAVVIYKDVRRGEGEIASLEGVFICMREPTHGAFADAGNPLCRRDEMDTFERMYKGKFVPFKRDK